MKPMMISAAPAEMPHHQPLPPFLVGLVRREWALRRIPREPPVVPAGSQGRR